MPGVDRSTRALTAIMLLLALDGCAEPARPSRDTAASTPAVNTPAVDAPPKAPSAAPTPPTPSSVVEAVLPQQAKPPAADAGSDAEQLPALLAADGSPLPQTRDRPSADGPGLRRRLERLVAAIAHDDPERALPAFFPRVAYEQVKAVAHPERDWEQRLVRAFRRDIHDYHRLLGRDAAGVRHEALVIDERRVRWMDPGTEGNRLGYHRVTRCRLRLRLSSGAERELELTSLISWRGEWYVVHLHGFG
jgi:hypothetical protein